MMNVCVKCGAYRADKHIDPSGPFAICPLCGWAHPFRRVPLLMISGASGAGKTTVYQHLLGTVSEAVLLDQDILWRPVFDQPETNYRGFFETWLRLAKNIAQSGKPVVLFGAGAGVVDNIEPCVERRYFGPNHYLNLVCEPEQLKRRLKARPAWRKSSQDDVIDRQVAFNSFLKEQAGTPSIASLDTTRCSVEETCEQVRDWITMKLNQ